jgi:hypothetical protein
VARFERERGSTEVTSMPPIRTVPFDGVSSPATMRSKVDLPQPEGPRSTRNSPALATKSISAKATVEPKRFSMWSSSTLAASI